MAHTNNTWQTGDTITATKLNNMEVVYTTLNTSTKQLDMTYAQIFNAMKAGKRVYVYCDTSSSNWESEFSNYIYISEIFKVQKYNTTYRVYAHGVGLNTIGSTSPAGLPGVMTVTVTGANAYPVYAMTAYVNTSYVVSDTSIG